MEDKKAVYKDMARKLKGIYRIPKCQGCSCFVDTLHDFHKALNHEKAGWSQEIWQEIQEASAHARTSHGCLGCNPCYPVPLANKLQDREESTATSTATCVLPATDEETSWPMEPGDYLVGNSKAPVAVCTLASESLPHRFALDAGLSDVAMIGKAETENIGIEKIIKNIVTNPRIRFFILAGREASGHLPGDALRCLFSEGTDDHGRIKKAKGIKPILKNVTPEQIDQFRRQVSLIDLEGEEDTKRIRDRIGEITATPSQAYPATAAVQPVPRIQTSETAHFVMDPKGFFILHLNPQENKILLEHYENNGTLTQVIEGEDPRAVYFTAIEKGLVSRLDHACYLGKELERAALSLKHGFPYIQDGAGITPWGKTA